MCLFLHFICVFAYSFISVCDTLTHRLMPSCETSSNCCQSNPPNTQTNTKASLLLVSEDPKHPNTPSDQAEGRHLSPLRHKGCDSLSGRRLSELLNTPIVALFSPRCRLNWPLQQRVGDLFLQPRAPANRRHVCNSGQGGACLLLYV